MVVSEFVGDPGFLGESGRRRRGNRDKGRERLTRMGRKQVISKHYQATIMERCYPVLRASLY